MVQDFNMGKAPQVRRDTVTSNTYELIRHEIMQLKFKPGQVLSEKDIALMLGVSRTPVRESFIRLERQGVLHIYPQRGTYVSKISQTRILEERFFRETLELAVFRDYLKNHSEKSIAQLKYHADMQRHAYLAGNYYESLQHDDAFHNVFYEDTNHMLCAHIQKTYSIDYQRVRLLSILDEVDINEINIAQHEKIIEAIVSGDHAAAMESVESHICKLNTEMGRILELYTDYFDN